jgi:hypothetical protein
LSLFISTQHLHRYHVSLGAADVPADKVKFALVLVEGRSIADMAYRGSGGTTPHLPPAGIGRVVSFPMYFVGAELKSRSANEILGQ